MADLEGMTQLELRQEYARNNATGHRFWLDTAHLTHRCVAPSPDGRFVMLLAASSGGQGNGWLGCADCGAIADSPEISKLCPSFEDGERRIVGRRLLDIHRELVAMRAESAEHRKRLDRWEERRCRQLAEIIELLRSRRAE